MIAGVIAHIASELTIPGVLSVLLPPDVGAMRYCNGCKCAYPSAEHGAASAESA